jgi:uncharacterized protein (DUF885 family)
LAALLDAFFFENLELKPEAATSQGFDKGVQAGLRSRLDDQSLAARTRWLAAQRNRLQRLHAIDRNRLSPAWALNYDVIDYTTALYVRHRERFGFGETGNRFVPYVLSQLSGSYYNAPDFLDAQHPVDSAADAEAYIARLSTLPGLLDRELDAQRSDAGKGVFAPDFILAQTLVQMQAVRGKPADRTTLVASIVKRTAEKGIPGDWRTRAERIVSAGVFPAFDRQMAYLKDLQPRAKPDAGVWRLPDGEAYYAGALEAATTTTMSPDEVHRVGLAQVAEMSARIDEIITKRGMTKGTVGERLTALNADPSQVYPNSDPGRAALIADLNAGIKHMYGLLPKAFLHMPKAAVEVRAVPVAIQDGAPNGYYYSAPIDGSRPAIYWINLKDTADWPKYTLPSLTYHEAVPGHHLQISVAQESDAIPLIRKTGGFSAYTEGWALYAEQVADELGVYADDPLGRAGRYQSFLFRAARLVVDTGMHSKRWNRAQATDYMVQATGFTVPRTQREIDRYVVWPGQACSYKVGHNKWIELRARVEKAQGAKFDIKQFHELLLLGALPLTILERTVDERIAANTI